jgi:hypothetical protein
VVGVFSLLTWQGDERTSAKSDPRAEQSSPSLTQAVQPSSTPAAQPPEIADEPAPQTVPETAPETKASNEAATPKVEAAKPDKPSPMGPPDKQETKPATPLVPRVKPLVVLPRPAGKPQDLAVATNPSGALATIDGNGASCTTPCPLPASPGLHSVSIRLTNYQEERREILVGTEAQEVPLISLRRAAGMLMITTNPTGATITINDKVQNQSTPAQISLPPGTYIVMVEKNGKQKVNRVEIRNGDTNSVRISLE